MGFCLFNNVAIAAEYAIRELGITRVFILDWDVHHGNGTAETFRRRPDVLFASIHQGGIYPGTGALGDSGSGPGEGYTINLPVPAGSEEDLWLSLLEHVVLPAAVAFEPGARAGLRGLRRPPRWTRWRTAGWRRAPSQRWPDTCATSPSARDAPLGAVLEGGYEPVGARGVRLRDAGGAGQRRAATILGARGAVDLSRRRSRRALLAAVSDGA